MISYQQTLTSKVEPCGRETFARVLVSDAVVSACREITRLRSLENETADEAARKRLHDEQGRLKRGLPAFLFMASFPGGKRRQAEAVLNGLVMLDFDNVTDPRAVFNGWKEGGKIDALGILLAHITPSGNGLRVVAKADAARGNLADNQAYIAAQLGMKPDEACKDASRISFAFPLDYLLYENKELFTYENKEFDEKYGAGYRAGNNSAPTHSGDGRGGNGDDAGQGGERRGVGCSPAHDVTLQRDEAGHPLFKGVAFRDIIAEWWRQQGGQPVVGERNQKLHRLAANLRYICDNSADALLEVMPRLGLEEGEMRQLVESAVKLKTYCSMPRALRKVLDRCGLKDAELQEQESDTRNMEEEYMARLDALKMPPAFEAVMAAVPRNVKIGALLAALPMVYTLASRVTFNHFDGTLTRLSGMTFIIGPAASGKSFILKLDKLLMEPIRMADKAGRRTEQEYRDSKELNKNKQKQMEKPHPVIRITPIQISNTMLALRMRDAVDSQDPGLHLHVYSCEAELATALRAQKGGSWIEKNDLYCKSFHNEYWGMDYANDQAINGEIQVNLNLVISGTEDAFDRLIPASTVLSGLPTRLMYFQMPDTHYKMIGKDRSTLADAQARLLKETAYALDQVRGFVDAKRLTDHMYKWCERIARRAEMEEDEELDDLRKRTAIIGERAGVAYALVAQADSFAKGEPLKFGKAELEFAEFVADYCLYSQYRKFAERMKEQKQRVADVAGRKRQPMLLAHVYNALPKKFSLEALASLRPGVSRNVLYANINRWKQKGYIKTAEKSKNYEKIISKV